MLLDNNLHLTYCTNIHPGESWSEVFSSLKEYVLPLKKKFSPDKDFGIGLRLSGLAAKELVINEGHLNEFKKWLHENGLYVFTMNGFPYGKFHREKVKDDVHKPDWITAERTTYTLNLIKILAEILPDGIEGGISTSPLSYKHWHDEQHDNLDIVYQHCSKKLAIVAEALVKIKEETGKIIHIDIEPEPDGLLENSDEVVEFFNKWLLPVGAQHLNEKRNFERLESEKAIKEHIQICYDICHFAVGFENVKTVTDKFKTAGIKIGKFQISAALKAVLPEDISLRKGLEEKFSPFIESTYLHQVVEKNIDESLTQYPDLPVALRNINRASAKEWRIHFHVPIFMNKYSELESTQEEVIEVLQLKDLSSITQHLEIETYTWEVLPSKERLNLYHSIERELEWVLDQLKTAHF